MYKFLVVFASEVFPWTVVMARTSISGEWSASSIARLDLTSLIEELNQVDDELATLKNSKSCGVPFQCYLKAMAARLNLVHSWKMEARFQYQLMTTWMRRVRDRIYADHNKWTDR